ncbi:MAG: tetratricopeptide repeat protein [Fibrobacteria bacterium]|nr:tetratricopeptide repeat protein [Fibrobacteria bacterium]
MIRSIKIFGIVLLLFLCAGQGFTRGVLEQAITTEIRKKISFAERYPQIAGVLFEKENVTEEANATIYRIIKRQIEIENDSSRNSYWAVYSLVVLESEGLADTSNSSFKQLILMLEKNVAASWIVAQAFYQQDLDVYAEVLLEKVGQLVLIAGYESVPPFTSFLLQEADKDIKAGRLELAKRKLQYATVFDYQSPWIPLYNVRLLLAGSSVWKANWIVISGEIKHWFDLMISTENSSIFILYVSGTISRVFVLFFLAGLIALFVKYFSHSTHVFAERLPGTTRLWFQYSAIAIALMCIPMLGAGWIICGLLMSYIVWPFLLIQEKYLVKSFLFFLFIYPLLLWPVSFQSRLHDPASLFYHYNQAVAKGYEPGKLAKVINIEPLTIFDKVLKNTTMSVLEKKRGDFDAAMILAEQALVIDATNCLALSNIGNLYFLKGNYVSAARCYKKALETSPDKEVLLFNLSQVELYLSRSDVHEKVFLQSLKHGERKVNHFIEMNHRFSSVITTDSVVGKWPLLRQVMDHPLSNQIFWEENFSFPTTVLANIQTWKLGVLRMPLMYLPFVVLLFVLLLKLEKSFFFRPRVFCCDRCKKVLCLHCNSHTLCQVCAGKSKGVSDGLIIDVLKKTSLRKRELFENLISNILNSCFPGMGLFYTSAIKQGVLLTSVTAFLWALVLQSRSALMVSPHSLWNSIVWVCGLILILMYLLFLIRLFFSVKSFLLREKE